MHRLEVLPPATQPWSHLFKRRHRPREGRGHGAYTRFRPCLRWEFGFTCSFCLLHESDIIAATVEGWGVTSTEHIVARSQDGTQANKYSNCLYICQLCNQARGNSPVRRSDGLSLLDPTQEVFADHFCRVEDELLPVLPESDASYTSETYDINDRRKRDLRHARRLALEESLAIVGQVPDLLEKLERRGTTEAAEIAEALRISYRSALRTLQRFHPVPQRAVGCQCGNATGILPAAIREQILQLEAVAL